MDLGLVVNFKVGDLGVASDLGPKEIAETKVQGGVWVREGGGLKVTFVLPKKAIL